MEQVFKIMAYMGLQYQTMYIKAYSSGAAERAAMSRGAISTECIKQCGQFAQYDFVA